MQRPETQRIFIVYLVCNDNNSCSIIYLIIEKAYVYSTNLYHKKYVEFQWSCPVTTHKLAFYNFWLDQQTFSFI